MRKKLLVIFIILTLVSCSDGKLQDIDLETAKELSYQAHGFIVDDEVIGINGSWITYDSSEKRYVLNLDVYELSGVDYEAYKDEITDHVNYDFIVEYNIIPFPTEPSIRGLIRDKEDGKILIIDQEYRYVSDRAPRYYNASWVTVEEDDLIVTSKGNQILFSDLEVGMYVESYSRGLILTTYPGQEETEKVVVHQDYVLPVLEDDQLEEIIQVEKVIYGPFPIINFDWSQALETLWDHEINLWMDASLGYYDNKGLNEAIIYLGVLNIYIGENDSNYSIENVLMKPNARIEFNAISDHTIEIKVPIYSDDKHYYHIYEYNKNGTFRKKP